MPQIVQLVTFLLQGYCPSKNPFKIRVYIEKKMQVKQKMLSYLKDPQIMYPLGAYLRSKPEINVAFLL